ncbi:acyl-CoA dehydrogenase family protein [bacterium]|nr:acyl-CoA dehydrogenase family protein [bacterium]
MPYFTEEQEMIRELAHRIAVEKIVPVREHYDHTGDFPWEIVEEIKNSDLFGVFIPEEFGGFGGGITEMAIVTEELSAACGGIALAFAASGLGAMPILLFGSDEQKAKYLPQIAIGEKLTAFALTEPNAGSDAGGIRTTARRDGDYYILDGTKQWITNGGEAKIYTIIALTDPKRGARGASAFIVEDGTEGFSYGKKEDKMGIRASATRELIFQECRIPVENLIMREGMGFMVAMETLDKSRPGVASQAIGIARGALEAAIDYARGREQFGKPVIANQGLQWMLADMATKVESARSFIYDVAARIDRGEKKISKLSAMVKLYAADVAMSVTTDAVQIFGGYGYMREYPVEKMMRDAKITQIYEGTNQIQRDVIGKALIKEAAKKR